MKIAIISDIHANVEALTASLSDISALGVEKIVVLGDIVGYGADPEACTRAVMTIGGDDVPPGAMAPELIRAVEPLADRLLCAIMGNHDLGAFDDDILNWMREEAVEAILWQRERLSSDALSFFSARPITVDYGDAIFVHASPHRPETFNYIFSHDDASSALAHVEGRLFFIGHTHEPAVYNETETVNHSQADGVRLNAGARYIVNVGSIGQPRDGDPRSSYVIWDNYADLIEFRKIEYDVTATANKIYEAGLPRILGDRLFLGM